MKAAPFAAAILLAGTAASHAGKADDYMACLIGQTAVALYAQNPPDQEDPNKTFDATAAKNVAYKKCKKPKGLSEKEWLDGNREYWIDHAVLLIVEGSPKFSE